MKKYGGYKMDKYENHIDKRIKELHERMRKFGNKKNLVKLLKNEIM